MKHINVMAKAPNMEARNIFHKSGILANRHTPLYKRNLLKITDCTISINGIVKRLFSQNSKGKVKLNLHHHANCQAKTDTNKSWIMIRFLLFILGIGNIFIFTMIA